MDRLIAFLSYQITEPLPLSNNSQALASRETRHSDFYMVLSLPDQRSRFTTRL